MANSGVDTARLTRLTRELQRVASNQRQEMGRVLASVRRLGNTEAKRKITGIYNVKQGRIAPHLKVTSDATLLQVSFVATGKPISAASYQGRQLRTGYRFKVLKSAAAVTIRRGFTQPRARVPLMRVGDERYPIKAIYGPSPPNMLANPLVADPLLATVQTRTEAEIVRRTQAAIERASS